MDFAYVDKNKQENNVIILNKVLSRKKNCSLYGQGN